MYNFLHKAFFLWFKEHYKIQFKAELVSNFPTGFFLIVPTTGRVVSFDCSAVKFILVM